MRYYIQNAAGEKYFFARLAEGEVPVSNQGFILGPIQEIQNDHYTCVVIAGYRKPYKVFTV